MLRFSLVFFIYLFLTPAFGQKVKYEMLAADAIYFNPGKSDIQNQYVSRLKSIQELLEGDSTAYLMIHAHTDSIGSYKDNELLAEQRAKAIISFFMAQKIDTSRLKIRSLGEYSPMYDDGTEEGRAKNRCVTLYVMAPWDEFRWYVDCVIKGQLKDAKSGAPLIGRILINNLNGKDTVYTDTNGFYEAHINIETYTEIRAYVKGYFFVSKIVKTKNRERHQLDFNLERAIVGGKMLFNDLYFLSGTANLLPSSERALQGILTFLQENDDLKMEIGGHINKPNMAPVAEDSESFKLSADRAKSVYDFLIKNGIAANRLAHKGYGNWEMINPRAMTEIEQQINRRVELKVLE